MNNLVFEDFTGKDGQPNCRMILDGKKISLHSLQPEIEAERIISHFSVKTPWVVIAGFGLGYIVKSILESTKLSIVLYEHDDQILNHARTLYDIDSLLDDPRVIRVRNQDELMEALEQNRIRELSFYIHRPYLQIFPDIYKNLEGLLISYLSKRQINQATLQRFQYTWLRNLIKNSVYFFDRPGLNHLLHPFSGKPAVIVGAGPSLKHDLEDLNRMQGKVCVIATDTAYPMLCAAGIKSDFIISVDPQNKNTLFLLYAAGREGCLVIDAAGSFLTFSKFNAENMVFYESFFPVYRELAFFWGSRGSLQSGGSVSTNAFDLARQLGCDPIIFSGQDLSYPGNRTHFNSNILEEFHYYQTDRLNTYDNYNSRMMLMADKIEVDANTGGKVSTDRRFLTYLEWFFREIRKTPSPVINTSREGARISGAQYQPLKKVLQDYSDIPNKSIRFEFNPVSSQSFRGYLIELNSEIEKLLPLARQAYSAAQSCKTLINIRQQQVFEVMNRFDRTLLHSLKNKHKTARFLELSMQSSIEKMAELSDISEINSQLVEGWIDLYYHAWRGLSYIQRLIQKRNRIDQSLHP